MKIRGKIISLLMVCLICFARLLRADGLIYEFKGGSFNGDNFEEAENIDMRGSRSIEFWFNSDVSASNASIEAKWVFFDWQKGGIVRCYFSGKDKNIWFVWLSTLGWKAAWGSYPFGSNEWVHIVCTFDEKDNKVRLYINGKIMPGSMQSSPISAPPSKLRIGGELVGKNYFKGKIKEFKIYDKALTEQEILKNYQKFAGPPLEKSSLDIPLPKMISEENLRKLGPIIIEGEDFDAKGGLPQISSLFSGGKAQEVGPAPSEHKSPLFIKKCFPVPEGKYWVFLKGYCSTFKRKYKVEINRIFVERYALMDLKEGTVPEKYHLLYLGAIEIKKSPAEIKLTTETLGGFVDCIYLLPINEKVITQLKEMPEQKVEIMPLKPTVFKIDLSEEYKGLDKEKIDELKKMQTSDVTGLLSYSIGASYTRKEKDFKEPVLPKLFNYRMIEGKPFHFAAFGTLVKYIDKDTGKDIWPYNSFFGWVNEIDAGLLMSLDMTGLPFTMIENSRSGFVPGYGGDTPDFPSPFPSEILETLKKLKHFEGFNMREWDGDYPLRFFWRRSGNKDLRREEEGYWKKQKGYLGNWPRTKKEACSFIKDYFKKQKEMLGGKVGVMNVCGLNHYMAEEGINYIMTELGSPAVFYQYLTASTRGAARQFQIPWGHYIAQYGGNSYIDGKQVGSFGIGGIGAWNPFGGLCPSLLRRAFYFSYMSGANWIVPEMGSSMYLIGDFDKDGIYQLSPRGKIVKEWIDFTLTHPDRGVPYTPIGIMLDYNHGYVPYYQNSNVYRQTWFAFPFEKADQMIDKFFGTIWPGTCGSLEKFLPPKEKEEEYYKKKVLDLWWRGPFYLTRQQSHLVNTPYGDVFDIILSNASQKVIGSYKAIFLLGEIEVDKGLAGRLTKYVKSGGTLVMTDFHKKSFNFAFISLSPKGNLPVLEGRYGKGRVIVIDSPFLMDEKENVVTFLPAVLHSIIDDFLPFQIRKISGGKNDPEYSRDIPVIEDAPVQYLINKNQKGWIITLINNNGVHESDEKLLPVIVYPEGKVEIEVTYKGKASKVIDWLKDEEVKINGTGEWTNLRLTIPPGHIRILEFVTGKVSHQ